MTLRKCIWQIGEVIAGDYSRSWSVGVWFVAGLTAVGFAAQAWWGFTFERALEIALLVATPIVLGRAALEVATHQQREDPRTSSLASIKSMPIPRTDLSHAGFSGANIGADLKQAMLKGVKLDTEVGKNRLPFIFISYAHSDAPFADAFSERLKKAGIPHFKDVKAVTWDEDISESVREGLEQATKLVLLISSANVQSEWVPYEIGYARGRDAVLTPYVLHPNLPLPDFIKSKQYLTPEDEAQFIAIVQEELTVYIEHVLAKLTQEMLTTQQILQAFQAGSDQGTRNRILAAELGLTRTLEHRQRRLFRQFLEGILQAGSE